MKKWVQIKYEILIPLLLEIAIHFSLSVHHQLNTLVILMCVHKSQHNITVWGKESTALPNDSVLTAPTSHLAKVSEHMWYDFTYMKLNNKTSSW